MIFAIIILISRQSKSSLFFVLFLDRKSLLLEQVESNEFAEEEKVGVKLGCSDVEIIFVFGQVLVLRVALQG